MRVLLLHCAAPAACRRELTPAPPPPHSGLIIYCSLPHIGTEPDNLIWNRTHPEFNWGEFVLADGAYVGTRNTVVPCRKNAAGYGAAEEAYNDIIAHYRSRVEHIIGIVQNHEFFRSPTRLQMPVVVAITKILVHATAVELRHSHSVRFRYPDTRCGPWPHCAPLLLS